MSPLPAYLAPPLAFAITWLAIYWLLRGCLSGNDSSHHFAGVGKMIELGSF